MSFGRRSAVSDVLGYVVVEWSGDRPPVLDSVGDELYEADDYGLAQAHWSARNLGADGGARFTVHAVMAEEIKEDQ